MGLNQTERQDLENQGKLFLIIMIAPPNQASQDDSTESNRLQGFDFIRIFSSDSKFKKRFNAISNNLKKMDQFYLVTLIFVLLLC